MWMVWLLWSTIALGGLFMGGGALLALRAHGFDLPLALNAALYLGCAVYALPRFVKLFAGKS
jgi:hypothetical protein